MALALAAEVSPRHISYLETGKAAPSQAMVLHLAEVLSVPKPVRNDWLTAAGFAPLFQSRVLDSEELRPFLAATERVLERHDPYPGWALDGHWRVIRANVAGAQLLGHLGLVIGDSLIDAILKDPTCGGLVVNWQEVVSHLASRLNAEARRRHDHATAKAAEQLAAIVPQSNAETPMPAAIPTQITLKGRTISLISLQALFNTAEDLTLSDVRIELFFPADTQSGSAFPDTAAGL